ncbi:hypothetical protein GCM10020221_14540 [Streptomyces thioluteus]|uniref:Uncharacterized protein n=1 Tax=Streptomyces thioluteus TaxID=66431 RepID=A0ABN3WLI6_STRTU
MTLYITTHTHEPLVAPLIITRHRSTAVTPRGRYSSLAHKRHERPAWPTGQARAVLRHTFAGIDTGVLGNKETKAREEQEGGGKRPPGQQARRSQ